MCRVGLLASPGAGRLWAKSGPLPFYKQLCTSHTDGLSSVAMLMLASHLSSCSRPNGPEVQSIERVALPVNLPPSVCLSVLWRDCLVGVDVYGCLGGPSQGTDTPPGSCTLRGLAGWRGGQVRQLQGRGRWDHPHGGPNPLLSRRFASLQALVKGPRRDGIAAVSTPENGCLILVLSPLNRTHSLCIFTESVFIYRLIAMGGVWRLKEEFLPTWRRAEIRESIQDHSALILSE